MPTIENPKLYNAIKKSAQYVFNTINIENNLTNIIAGTALYRYTGYRNYTPQQEKAGRTIWQTLENDTHNRWTGAGTAQGEGHQGLYLSLEYLGSNDTSFAELEHYQDHNAPKAQTINYFVYSSDNNKKNSEDLPWESAPASELRSMFLFTSAHETSGLNLEFNEDSTKDGGILNLIYKQAKEEHPEIIGNKTLQELYYDSNDASFTRAVGNAAFETGEIEFLKVSSVRDKSGQGINIVMAGKSKEPLDILIPQGRATFYIDPNNKTTSSVYTMADLQYNYAYEKENFKALAPASELDAAFTFWRDKAKAMSNSVNWSFAEYTIKSKIDQVVSEQLSLIDNHFQLSLSDLESRVYVPAQHAFQDTLENFVKQSATLSNDYQDVISTIGEQPLDNLLNEEIIYPRYQQATSDSSNNSYLRTTINTILSDKKLHYLSQNATELQKKDLDLQKALQTSEKAIAQKTDQLDKIDEELSSKPQDTNLKEQKAQLRKDIDAEISKQKEAQFEKQESEQEALKNNQESEQLRKDHESYESLQKEAASRVFGE